MLVCLLVEFFSCYGLVNKITPYFDSKFNDSCLILIKFLSNSITQIDTIHLGNLLTATLLFRNFLENLNFELKILLNTKEQCFPVRYGY